MTHAQPRPQAPTGEELLAKYGAEAKEIAYHSVRMVLREKFPPMERRAKFRCEAHLDCDGDPFVSVYVSSDDVADYDSQYATTRAIHEHMDFHGIGMNASIPFCVSVWYVSERVIENDPP